MGMVHYVKAAARRQLLAGITPAWISNRGPRAAYIRAVCLSAPPWVDKRALMALHAQAAALTRSTGHLHVLDHVVPLRHPRVCGLTVPWNLRVVHWRVNSAKGNDWNPDQGELWPSEEVSANV